MYECPECVKLIERITEINRDNHRMRLEITELNGMAISIREIARQMAAYPDKAVGSINKISNHESSQVDRWCEVQHERTSHR